MSYYLEYLALIWFFACWGGYTWYSRNRSKSRSCLSNTLDLYREDWMRVMLKRENRISDASLVGNLERNGAFFASSCLLILAGIITALGYTSEAMEIFAAHAIFRCSQTGNLGVAACGVTGGLHLRIFQVHMGDENVQLRGCDGW